MSRKEITATYNENHCKRRLFIGLVFFHLALFIIILLFCNIKYEVSDDYIMEMVVSGAYTGQPDCHYLFSNVISGWILTIFYRIFPQISWYFWEQMLLCFLSYLAITYVLVQKLDPSPAISVVLLFTAFTAGDLYILPQFTKTAFAASMAGLILLLWSVYNSRSRICRICGFLLAYSGSLIRTKAFFIAVVFAGIIVIHESFYALNSKQWKLKEIILKAWIPGCLLLISVFLSAHIDQISYSHNSEYSYYKAFARTRAHIVDYTYVPYEECSNELEAAGISENDYNMILDWDFADSDVFSLKQMNKVLDILQQYRHQQSVSILDFLKSVRHRQVYYPIAWCCLLAGLLCIFCCYKKVWVPFLAMIELIAFLFYFYSVGRSVYRVEFGIFYCAALLILYFCHGSLKKPKWNSCLCLIMCLISLIQMKEYIPDSSWKKMNSEEYRTCLDSIFYYSWNYDARKYSTVINPGYIRSDFLKLLNDNPDSLYVLDFNTAIQTLYYDFSIFKSSRVCFPKNAVFLGGVTMYHPSVTDYLDNLGYYDLLDALTEENVYFVSNNSQDFIYEFYEEHCSDTIEMYFCDEIDGYKIWKYVK